MGEEDEDEDEDEDSPGRCVRKRRKRDARGCRREEGEAVPGCARPSA